MNEKIGDPNHRIYLIVDPPGNPHLQITLFEGIADFLTL